MISDLTSLQGDFRAVEESFKSITRNVQKQQSEAVDSRGQILGSALAAEDRLKEEDQAPVSKHFLKCCYHSLSKMNLEKIIRQLDELDELASQTEGKARVKGMIGNLSKEASRVQQTTRRLNSTLRRLLDSRISTTRLRLATVLREIHSSAVRQSEAPPELSMNVFTELDLYNGMERPFWQTPVEFEAIEIKQEEPDEVERLNVFQRLAELQRLDWDDMRANINSQIEFKDRVPLPDLLNAFPPENGPLEILGYIQLAYDGGHEVHENDFDLVRITSESGTQDYEIPQVVFLSEIEKIGRLSGSAVDE